MLDFNLTPEQREVRKQARAFALLEVLPVAWEYDEKDEVPLFVLEKAFSAGLMNTDIPRHYGGKGFGILESALITEEVAAACPGLATSIFDNSLGMGPLLLSSNEKLKTNYLGEIRKNFKLICFATSEPVTGSDVSGIRCLAEADGADFVLNGSKYWITNGGIADYMTIFATVDPKLRYEGIGAFLIEKNWPGVSIGRPIPKLGQRCSNTVGIRFENVRVPKENIIAPPGEGFALAMKTFARTRPVIGAFAVGAARSAMEYAIDYVKKRRAFGKKLVNFQAVQFKIADMYQKVETARLLTWKAAWEADNGIDPTISASVAKLYAAEAAQEVVDEALQVFGGYGYTRMFPLEKLLRDTRLFRIYEGTSEIQRVILSGFALNDYKPVMPALEDLPLLRNGVSRDGRPPGKDRNAWRCRMCGHIHYGNRAPDMCPYCFFPERAFKKIRSRP